jgi:hypothetical protein
MDWGAAAIRAHHAVSLRRGHPASPTSWMGSMKRRSCMSS